MRQINTIIIHCSASPFGDVLAINRWHRERGWSGIGYHFVITNGIFNKRDDYNPARDGLVQPGRKTIHKGAHCKGHNSDSIGICLIGNEHFTSKQLLALQYFLRDLLKKQNLSVDDIRCHYEFDPHKTCPNIDIGLIRDLVHPNTQKIIHD